jgi:hypothetical protein
MILQSQDRDPAGIDLIQSGVFEDGADIYACRTIVPWSHKLVAATLTCMNAVTTGTVEVMLRFTDPGSGRGGAQIGLKLENDDLDALANSYNRWVFDLQTYKGMAAPAYRQYFVVGTATDVADRLDELVLLLDVERV